MAQELKNKAADRPWFIHTARRSARSPSHFNANRYIKIRPFPVVPPHRETQWQFDAQLTHARAARAGMVWRGTYLLCELATDSAAPPFAARGVQLQAARRVVKGPVR